MAAKKVTGGSKKPSPKRTTATGAAKKTTTSRGSNTMRQVGDQNMREYSASNIEKDLKKITAMNKKYNTTNRSGYYSKVSEAEASGNYGGVGEMKKFRTMQRAGGKVLSAKEQKVKAKVTKSRGSKTSQQVGDQNQREGYNSVRGKSAKSATTGKKIYTSKLTKAAANKSKGAMTAYKQQRAGGKGK